MVHNRELQHCYVEASFLIKLTLNSSSAIALCTDSATAGEVYILDDLSFPQLYPNTVNQVSSVLFHCVIGDHHQ